MWQDDLVSLTMEDEDDIPVLVCVVPSAEDWERVLSEGWYRIPIRRAPKRIGARYVAFYHTSACGPNLRWSIRAYAEVQGYGLATRAELIPEEADHPRANERYYRLSLGPLQMLPEPIPAHKLRRVTFISTTLDRLLTAREINDLWVRDSAQAGYARAYAERDMALREVAAAYRTRPTHLSHEAPSYSAMMPGT